MCIAKWLGMEDQFVWEDGGALPTVDKDIGLPPAAARLGTFTCS